MSQRFALALTLVNLLLLTALLLLPVRPGSE